MIVREDSDAVIIVPFPVRVNVGVVIVGDVANTLFPVPVDVVSAASRFALLGVARNVATFVPGVVVASAVSPRAARCNASDPIP